MIFASPLPAVPLPQEALTPYTLARAAELGGKAALVDAVTGSALTYAELDEAIRTQAGGWIERGLAKGDVVAIMAPNCPEYATVFHSVALAGGAVTTINPTYTVRELVHQLNDAGATRLVTVPGLEEAVAAAIPESPVRETFVIGTSAAHPSLSTVKGARLEQQVPVDLDDVVALPYSSGTTGLSKGVMLTHRNLTANMAEMQAVVPIHEDDAYVAFLPFFHIYGMQILMNMGLRAGATIFTMPRFDLQRFLQLHEANDLTRAFVAPPTMVLLAKDPSVDDYNLSALRLIFSGAAPLSAELAEECAKRLDCEIAQGYGMTELSPASHATPAGGYKPGSVGITISNTETRIVDPATGESLGVGADGEVWVRGPQVMKGYLNNAAATAATIDDDGWLHTGDIGRFDEDGHLSIVDRLKELIKYKGFQVPPAELEALLLTHPAVADAAVIGIPDDDAGEIPAAYVVLKAGADVSPADLQTFVADRAAHYKQIRRLELVDAIPKSPSGKILRRVLRERASAPQ